MGEIRFGIIGMGTQGQLYARILAAKPLMAGMTALERPAHCRLSAVCNRSSASLKERENEPGISVFSDYKEMLAAHVCDAIVITVPHLSHAEIAVEAIRHKIHVLCEKPAAIAASDVQKMLAASVENPSVSVGIMFNQRVNQVYKALKNKISSGELGMFRRYNWIANNWWRPDSYYASGSWRGTWQGEGGGILVNQVPHQLDLCAWLFGRPENLFAICREGAYRHISVDDEVTLVSTYPGGATGVFTACTTDPLGKNRLEIDFSKGKVIVNEDQEATIYHFTKDEADWNDTYDYRVFLGAMRRDPDSIYTTEIIKNSVIFGQNYKLIFENFAAHILYGEPLIADLKDGLVETQIANTAYLSAKRHAQLPFPCEEEDYHAFLQDRIAAETRNAHANK